MSSEGMVEPAVQLVHPTRRAQRGPLEPVLLCALLVGALVRLSFILAARFPLNDGGLFYLMTQELQQAGYRLPLYTSYNAAQIPFAYPPLGFYLAGLLDSIGPWSLFDVFRFEPLILNLLTIAAFYALARALFSNRTASAVAVFAFALMPRSFQWMIMGGGVTRSLGFLLGVMAVQQAHALYTRGGRWHLVSTTLLAGLTVLSHLEMAVFVAVSIVLFLLVYGRSRAGFVRSLVVALGAGLVSAPWWGLLIARYGPTPLLSASQHGWGLLSGPLYLLLLYLTEEPAFPVFALLALLGLLVCLADRRWLLPAWVLALFVLDPRSAHTPATVPLALLVGIGITEQLMPALHNLAQPWTDGAQRAASEGMRASRFQRRLAQGLLGFAFVYALVAALMPGRAILTSLSYDEREAMRWLSEHTPESSTFLVVTGDMWAVDRSSEWFPVLTARRSVVTVQGHEWTGDLAQWRDRSEALQECAAEGARCLDDWAQETGIQFTYVYLAKRPTISQWSTGSPCCTGLASALRCDPGYRLVYDGPGATVYEVGR